jgi:hypothetical protein
VIGCDPQTVLNVLEAIGPKWADVAKRTDAMWAEFKDEPAKKPTDAI